MVTVQEATEIILKNCFIPSVTESAITDSVGKVLGQNVFADRDFPPFDRVTMDGIAISHASLALGRRVFQIENMQAAGEPRKVLLDPAKAMEVMTGAPVPEGTDTVIRYEDIEIADGLATVRVAEASKGQNIHQKGSDADAGELLLKPGTLISPAEVALLASTGLSKVKVLSYPPAAIVSGGDELVAIDSVPAPHQVRRSNSYAIHAAMQELHWPATLHHFPDEKVTIKKSLQEVLEKHDVVILSGGVSKGKFDYIPEALTELGVKKLFHGVSQRPGKPMWFGVTEAGKTVFALPGNPVSTFMCFQRYVKPWLFKSIGVRASAQTATLATNVKFEPSLTFFLQVYVVNQNGLLVAFPKAGGGSGDFANLREVNGFLELPLEKNSFAEGEAYPFIAFR